MPYAAQHRLDATKLFSRLDDGGEREELDPALSAGEGESPTLSAISLLDRSAVSPEAGGANNLESNSPSSREWEADVPSEEDIPEPIPDDGSDDNDEAQDDNVEEQVGSDASSISIWYTPTDGISAIPSTTIPSKKTSRDANTLVTVPSTRTESTIKGRTRKRVTFGQDTVAGTAAQPARPYTEEFELGPVTE